MAAFHQLSAVYTQKDVKNSPEYLLLFFLWVKTVK